MIVVVVFAFGGGARGLFHGSCCDIIEDQSRRQLSLIRNQHTDPFAPRQQSLRG